MIRTHMADQDARAVASWLTMRAGRFSSLVRFKDPASIKQYQPWRALIRSQNDGRQPFTTGDRMIEDAVAVEVGSNAGDTLFQVTGLRTMPLQPGIRLERSSTDALARRTGGFRQSHRDRLDIWQRGFSCEEQRHGRDENRREVK